MKTAIAFLFTLMLAFSAFGQKKPDTKTLPPLVARQEYSSVYDIRNFEKFTISAVSPDPTKSVAAIGKVLSEERSIAPADAKQAQFTVRYRELNGTSEMRVYYLKDERAVIVWAEDRAGRGRETELTDAFLKVLQRNKKLFMPNKPADAE